MITKSQLLDSIRHEVRVIKHLATKIPVDGYHYRPTPEQRSTLELMQYLTVTGLSGAEYCLNGTWDHAERLRLAAEKVTPESFAEAMDAQLQRIEEILGSIDDREAETREMQGVFGGTTTVGAGLMDTLLKTLVAYRMQLFLYAKQSGDAALGSYECWAGIDPPVADA